MKKRLFDRNIKKHNVVTNLIDSPSVIVDRKIDAAMTGDITGVYSKVEVDTVTLTGNLRGMQTQVNVIGGADGVVTVFTIGHNLGMYSAASCEHTSNVIGYFLNNYLLGTKGATYDMVRLEENGTMVVDNVFFVGVTDADYFLCLRPATPSGGAWDMTTDITSSGSVPSVGFLKVTTVVGDKAIPLYDV